jgi:hypothetical protein
MQETYADAAIEDSSLSRIGGLLGDVSPTLSSHNPTARMSDREQARGLLRIVSCAPP